MTALLDPRADGATGAPTAARRSTARQPPLEWRTVEQPPGRISARAAIGSAVLARRAHETVTAALAWLGTALLSLTGVALAVSGLGITGGSFGLLAFIGMPLLVVGLGMISAAQAIAIDLPTRSGRATAPIPAPIPTTIRSTHPTQGAHTP